MRPFAGLGLWFALLLGGCGGAQCPKLQHRDPAVLLAQHRAAHRAVRSLRAQAKVDQRSKEGRIKGKVMMFLERPDRVRFDAVTQFGPALILTSDGETFALSDFKENRFLTGPACERNIARMIGVAMSARDVVSALFGDAPSEEEPARSLRCAGDGTYAIETAREDGLIRETRLGVHGDDMKKPPAEQRTRVSEVILKDPRGKVLVRVRYDDYRKVKGGIWWPFTVHVVDERNGADALLRFEEIAVDVDVPEGAFAQTPRPGLSVEGVLCSP
jgi:outer membrane lipoprotein-sorting protein